jgi:hypothetical protein
MRAGVKAEIARPALLGTRRQDARSFRRRVFTNGQRIKILQGRLLLGGGRDGLERRKRRLESITIEPRVQ